MDELNLYSNDNQYVIIKVDNQQYGLEVAEVREMLVLPEVTEVPQSPAHMRGIINLRGQVIPLFDLRIRMGLPSAQEEKDKLLALMDQREQDHKNWIEELEACLREDREFGLALDPHQCAFGKWLDTYQTHILTVNTLLAAFQAPHARIHALAGQAFQIKAEKGTQKALEFVESARQGPLGKLIELFGDFRKAVENSFREIVLVAEEEGRLMALSVDEVESVEGLRHEESDDMSRLESGQGGLIESVARRMGEDEVVFILDAREFFDQTEELSF